MGRVLMSAGQLINCQLKTNSFGNVKLVDKKC